MKELRNADLSSLSGYGCSAYADILIEIETRDELLNVYERLFAEGLGIAVIGGGFNTLFGPEGVRGALLRLRGEFESVRKNGKTVVAGAALPLPSLLKFAAENSLKGLEFMAGIPGTVGGAAACNSGTAGEWVQNVLRRIEVMRAGRYIGILTHEAGFSYRKSALNSGDIITECVFELSEGETGEIFSGISGRVKEKNSKHPSGGNCGCVFKNPDGGRVSAGMLIRNAGLAGLSEGGAFVSPQHCNFIVCGQGAGARDVWNLIKKIKKTVMEKTGYSLETELNLIGEGFD